MSLTPTEQYFELDYVESGYVGGIADPKIIFTPYFAEDYIDSEDYVENSGVIFGLTADLSLSIQDLEAAISATATVSCTVGYLITGSADLINTAELGTVVDNNNLGTVNANIIASGEISITDAFNASITVVATRTTDTLLNSEFNFSAIGEVIISGESLLSYFAALDAQAARTADLESALNSSANVDALPAVTYTGAADLVSAATLTCAALNVQIADATLVSASAMSVNAIEYRSRFIDSDRPIDWTAYNYTNSGYSVVASNYTFNTVNPRYGTANLRFNTATVSSRRALHTEAIDVSDFNTGTGSWVLEFWHRPTVSIAGNYHLLRLGTQSTPNIDLFSTPPYATFTSNSNLLDVFVDDSQYLVQVGPDEILTSLGGVSTTTFTHLAIVWTGSRFEFYRNGSLADFSFEPDSIPFNTSNLYITLTNQMTNSANEYDNLAFRTNTTAFVYPADETNDTNTRILSRFDGNLNDDTSIVFTDSPTLASTSAVSASITGVVEGSADLTAFYSQVSVTGFVSDFFVNADISASISTTITKITTASADMASEFALTADIDIVKTASADLQSISSVAAELDVVKGITADLEAFYSQLTVAGVVGDYFINMDSTASISTVPGRIRPVSAALSMVSSQVADTNAVRSGSGDLVTACTTTITASATLDHAADFVSTSTITAAANRTRDHSADFNTEFGTVIDASRIPGQGFAIDSLFALSAGATVIRSGVGTLNSPATLNALAGVAFEGAADLTGFVSIISINKILHTDQYLYLVPREIRSYAIPTESRTHRITTEVRTYSIQGDS